MSALLPSGEISIKWVMVVRVPHEKGSTCPAFLDPDIYESYWISLRELVHLLEVEEQKDLSAAARRLLSNVFDELIEATGKEEDNDVTTAMQPWVAAFREAVGLIPAPAPDSGLSDDFGHCRKLVWFLDQHLGCSEKLVFEVTWGW